MLSRGRSGFKIFIVKSNMCMSEINKTQMLKHSLLTQDHIFVPEDVCRQDVLRPGPGLGGHQQPQQRRQRHRRR